MLFGDTEWDSIKELSSRDTHVRRPGLLSPLEVESRHFENASLPH